MLLGLTAVTGLIDAVSILSLGRVFVANMTGNVVFVGFALAGASGFSLESSLSALAGFLVGALGGGAAIEKIGADRAKLLSRLVSVELALMVAALVLAVSAGAPFSGPVRDVIAALAAVAMGLQNSVVRRLAVPDLTSTVLTMTLTSLASDASKGGNRASVVRRLLAVATMLGGAVAGASLVLHGQPSYALGLAVGVLSVVTVGAFRAARRPAPWH